MHEISFDSFTALQIVQPLKVSFDKDNALIDIQKNIKDCDDWMALPIEWEIGAPDTPYTKRLAVHCAAAGVKRIIGFSPDYLKPESLSEILEGDPTAENLFKIESTFALRTYTILPDPAKFQLFSDGDYYSVFVGSGEFLMQVLGMDLEQGIKKFKEYAGTYKHGSIENNIVMKVLGACEEFNSSH